MIKNFTYTKANGDTSNRTVFVIQEPTDNMLGIDLSEYDSEEVVAFEEVLSTLHRQFLDGIKEFGLDKNWRNFKKSRMSPIKGD